LTQTGSHLRVPPAIRSKYGAVVELTDSFCHDHLGPEHAKICRDLAATLARRRPSPLVNGSAKSWACGIVHVMARVNFLFDQSSQPHVTVAELRRFFGLSQSTPSARSKVISRLLGILAFDSRWTVPSKRAQHPLARLFSIDMGTTADTERSSATRGRRHRRD
jgi:hypothetical protein